MCHLLLPLDQHGLEISDLPLEAGDAGLIVLFEFVLASALQDLGFAHLLGVRVEGLAVYGLELLGPLCQLLL
jgi:hypothetical protein